MTAWLAAHPYADFAALVIVYALLSAWSQPRWQRITRAHEYVAPDCGSRCCRECVVCGRAHS